MSKKPDINILLTLLIILSVVAFTRTFLYILFDKEFLNSGKHLGLNIDLIMEGVLTIFAVLRLYISSLVLFKKGLDYDMITYVLLYLIFTSFVRFYYEYLYFYNPESKQKYYVDKFQDVNAVAIFIASGYILYYIFFK
jgi:hypothetical protein